MSGDDAPRVPEDRGPEHAPESSAPPASESSPAAQGSPVPEPSPASVAGDASKSEESEESEESVEPSPEAEPGPALTGRQRLAAALWPPRVNRAQLVVALLLFALGPGVAFQVRANTTQNQIRGARQDDLVRILDEVDARQQRLDQERTQLQQSLTQLQTSSNQAKEAQAQTQLKEQQLGVLAGTVAATGPGVTLTIKDPGGNVQAAMLLNTLEELRAAGAEAVQINNVRVVAGTWFSDANRGTVTISGTTVSEPYVFTAIGNPQDLDTALNIPGGVVQSVASDKGTATVKRSQSLDVTALIPLSTPDYAHTTHP
ncbi:DUF881 domain-containing protein [Streptacidiphilus neutrinimicus]|uniref:DUF881 domain-containing protein n=1 Tax=Streptacidiphilus neutrinimicus TaxID=105420 RepID=UPI000A02816E|nr:DUF881 domain-containing protein [Streptacidiphilus neutrinimicus]